MVGEGLKIQIYLLSTKNIHVFSSEMKCLYCLSLSPIVGNNFGTWLFEGYFYSS